MEEVVKAGTEGLPDRVGGWVRGVREYVLDLQTEMRRVTWPSWKQVRATTCVVIGAVFAFALYFAIVDMAVARMITTIFDSFTK